MSGRHGGGGGRYSGNMGRLPMGMNPNPNMGGQGQVLGMHQPIREHGGRVGYSHQGSYPSNNYRYDSRHDRHDPPRHDRHDQRVDRHDSRQDYNRNQRVTPNPAGSNNSNSQPSNTVQSQKQAEPAQEEKIDIEVCAVQPTAVSSCFHPTEPLLLTGDTDGTVTVYKVCNEVADTFCLSGSQAVNDIECVGRWVFVGAGDTIYGYTVESLLQGMKVAAEGKAEGEVLVRAELNVQPELRATLQSKDGVAVTLAWCGALNELVVGDSAGQVWKFSIDDEGKGQQSNLVLVAGPWPLHRSSVVNICFDDDKLVTASHDGTVLFTHLKGGEVKQLTPCLLEMEARSGVKRSSSGAPKSDTVACAVNCMDIDSDCLWLVVGGDVPYISIVCLTTGKVRKTILLPCSDWRVKSIKFLKASILVGVDDSTVLTYSLEGQLLSVHNTVSETVHSLAVSPDGKWAATGRNTSTEIF